METRVNMPINTAINGSMQENTAGDTKCELTEDFLFLYNIEAIEKDTYEAYKNDFYVMFSIVSDSYDYAGVAYQLRNIHSNTHWCTRGGSVMYLSQGKAQEIVAEYYKRRWQRYTA